jgi:hypothetical protein
LVGFYIAEKNLLGVLKKNGSIVVAENRARNNI